MFGGVGPMEVVLVLAIALIVLGPKKLPEAARSVGKGLREFKDSMSEASLDDDHEDEQDEVQAEAEPVPPRRFDTEPTKPQR
jgi:sec-independent protein translocase protein TatA